MLGTRVLPRWLGWGAAVAAPNSDLAELPVFLFLVWIVAVSIVLVRRAEEARSVAASPAASVARAATRG